MQPYTTRANYASYPSLTNCYGDFMNQNYQQQLKKNQNSLSDFTYYYPQTSSSSTMSNNTCYKDLKKEQLMVFVQKYLSEFPSLPVKPEFDKYFNDNLEQWNTLKLKLENEDINSDDLVVLNPVNENFNSNNDRDCKPKQVGRKRLSQYQVKVEDLPVGKKISKTLQQQLQYDMKNENKTYHSFTIMPKNRKTNTRSSTEELIDLTTDSPKQYIYNQSPPYNSHQQQLQQQYSMYSNPSNNNCTSASPTTSAYMSSIQMSSNQNQSNLLNEVKTNSKKYSNYSKNTHTLDQNKSSTEHRSPQGKSTNNPVKKREVSRTFCNGARAIVSYFSLDDKRIKEVKSRRNKTSPFTEYNSRAPVGTVP